MNRYLQTTENEGEQAPTGNEFRAMLKNELQVVIQELRELKGDVKAVDTQLNTLEEQFSRFESTLEQVKLDTLVVDQQLVVLETKLGKLDSANQALDEEVGELNTTVEDLEASLERLDNAQWKNNIKIRGLKEGLEGLGLVGFLMEQFTGWVGADSDINTGVLTAYRVGSYNALAKYPQDIIGLFPLWPIKS